MLGLLFNITVRARERKKPLLVRASRQNTWRKFISGILKTVDQFERLDMFTMSHRERENRNYRASTGQYDKNVDILKKTK